jgi:exopolysaccharide biosynthesis polyprenyl glycosylphosphotransferase
VLSTEDLQREHTRKTATGRFARRLQFTPTRPARRGGAITEGDAGIATSVREGLYRRGLAMADALATAATVLVVLPLLAGNAPPWLIAAAVPLVVVLNKVLGVYERDELVLNKSTLDEAPKLMQAAAMSSLLLWLSLDGWSTVELDSSDVLVVWASMFVLLLATRTVARRIARRAAATERVLVLGEGASIGAVKEKLASGRVNARVVASLPLDHRERASSKELGSAFRSLVRRHDVDRAIIAPSAGGSEETVDLIRVAKHAGVRVSVLPRMLEVVGSAVEFDHVDGLTMLGVRRFGLSRSSRTLKRTFDLLGSSLLLLAAAPVMGAIALAVKLDSRGPVFFRQTRVGKDGERFEMLKFRSMGVDAEARKDALRHLNQTEGLFKIEDDPRVTRVGRLLRKSSLDELPQLINVWRGEMSLVGPRPLVVDEDAQVHGFDRHRLHLTPGMTGHWQILGATRVPLHEMVGIDYLYVANWSLWSDVKILLRTIPHMIASRGV